MHSQTFIDEMKQKLLESKREFEEELRGLKPHTEMGDEADENASEIGVDEASQGVITRIESDLKKIDAALERIKAGTYGVDEEGSQIPEERLRVLPWAEKGV
jgi:RNA polymerase-binding transcription factor DksA